MRRGRRFLAYGMGALAAATAAGRVVTRRDGRRPDPCADHALGSVRGEHRELHGPRGSRLYTEWFPPGTKAGGTLVLTHGYCLTEAVWHYQKLALPSDRVGAAVWDLPGHGHSPGLPPGSLTLDVAADALAKVVDEYAGPAGTVLVGHSLGGVVTLTYLARHPDTAADRVRGVVLVSTPMMHIARSIAGRWPGAGLEALALGKVMQYVVESDLAERVLGRETGTEDLSLSYRVVRWGFGRDPSPSQVRFVRDAIASVRPDVRAETYRMMNRCDLGPLLPEIKVPALVVIGEQDRLVNPEESRLLGERLPRAETIALPDAGHAAFLEEHQSFNDAVRRFAEDHLHVRRQKAGA